MSLTESGAPMSVRQHMYNHILQGFLAIIVAGALPWGCIVHCMMHTNHMHHHVHHHGAECDMMVTVRNEPLSPNQFISPHYTPAAVHVVIISRFLTIKEFRVIEAVLTKKLMLYGITIPPLSPPPQ